MANLVAWAKQGALSAFRALEALGTFALTLILYALGPLVGFYLTMPNYERDGAELLAKPGKVVVYRDIGGDGAKRCLSITYRDAFDGSKHTFASTYFIAKRQGSTIDRPAWKQECQGRDFGLVDRMRFHFIEVFR